MRSPKFYGSGEDNLYMYLILQLCTGGELQDWLLRRSEQEVYTEQTAAKVAYDVLQVLTHAYTHMRARARARARARVRARPACIDVLAASAMTRLPAAAAGAAQVPRAGHRA